MPQIVTVRTWLRWLLRENARNSRKAHERAAQSEDWAKDLTPADLKAMEWAREEEED
ncbi:MAG: hypothetical protein V1899_03035 [Planctomycetota bacterium]